MTSDTLVFRLKAQLNTAWDLLEQHAAEMHRVNTLNAEMHHLLKCSLEMLRMGSFPTGYCCCGSAVDSHGMGDGHSPVDSGDYAARRLEISIEAVLARIEPPQQITNRKAQQNDL